MQRVHQGGRRQGRADGRALVGRHRRAGRAPDRPGTDGRGRIHHAGDRACEGLYRRRVPVHEPALPGRAGHPAVVQGAQSADAHQRLGVHRRPRGGLGWRRAGLQGQRDGRRVRDQRRDVRPGRGDRSLRAAEGRLAARSRARRHAGGRETARQRDLRPGRIGRSEAVNKARARHGRRQVTMIRSDGMAALAAAVLALGAGSVHATAIGGPLNLADEGMFFVNGKTVDSKYPGVSPAGPVKPGAVTVNQMYVHYRIPAQRASAIPIVLVHGGGLTGASFETTPDGREGWATYLVRKGQSVYVVDTPGRGRAGFNATAINQAKVESDVSVLPASVLMVTSELAWTLFRFGPSYGTPYANTQFPVEAVTNLGSQGVPLAEVMLDGGAMGTAPPALAALLDKIGPVVVVVHS